MSYLLLIQHKNFNFKAHFLFCKKCKGGTLTNIFACPANFKRPLYQSRDSIRTLNIFSIFSILFELPTIDSAQKILILKHIFYFLKSVKGGPLTKIFATPANFNGPLCQSQIFFPTLNIFSILFELPTIDSAQKI